MRGEAQELRILQHAAAAGTRIVDDDGAHLVEQQLAGHAAKVREPASKASITVAMVWRG